MSEKLKREGAIDSMCMTWRHDFGLHKPEGDEGFLSSGMTSAERDSLRRKMAQLYNHHVEPLLLRIRELESASQPGGGEEPEWIVNDLGELGVHIGLRFFFLYKGDNIEYGKEQHKNGIALHDDGTPMQYRIVGKREFGETCLPMKWLCEGSVQPRYTEELVYTPGLSFGSPEDGEWRVLPAAPSAGNGGAEGGGK